MRYNIDNPSASKVLDLKKGQIASLFCSKKPQKTCTNPLF